MITSDYRVRRATVDDLPTLKSLWAAMQIPTADLERRVTEFQVAEGADEKVIGAVGFQIVGRHGLIHSEGFSDFAVADQVRPLWLTRIHSLAMNHGVARLWTRENAPFWTRNGLQSASDEELQRLPVSWDRAATGWLTLRLKDEEAIASLEKEFDMFVAAEKRSSAESLDQTRKLKVAVTAVGLAIALSLVGWAVYLLIHRAAPLPPQGRAELIRVVGAAHHRPAGDVDKAHRPRALAMFREFFRRDEIHDGQMFQGRLQILAEREQVAIRRPQILQRGEHFCLRLAQAQHHAGLGVNRGAAFGFHFGQHA